MSLYMPVYLLEWKTLRRAIVKTSLEPCQLLAHCDGMAGIQQLRAPCAITPLDLASTFASVWRRVSAWICEQCLVFLYSMFKDTFLVN